MLFESLLFKNSTRSETKVGSRKEASRMLSAYEEQRLENIRQNQAVLASLGLTTPLIPSKTVVARRPKEPQHIERREPSQRKRSAAPIDQLDALLASAKDDLQDSDSVEEKVNTQHFVNHIKEIMGAEPKKSLPEIPEMDEDMIKLIEDVVGDVTPVKDDEYSDDDDDKDYSPPDSDDMDDSSAMKEKGQSLLGKAAEPPHKPCGPEPGPAYHKRPRGRGRKGKTWCHNTGKWVKENDSGTDTDESDCEEYTPEVIAAPAPIVEKDDDDDISQYIKPKYKKTVPMCPMGCCKQMKNRKGHGKRWFKKELKNVYKYECLRCGLQYTNFPGASMDTAALSSGSKITFGGFPNPAFKIKKPRVQTCSICGQLRKGHICGLGI